MIVQSEIMIEGVSIAGEQTNIRFPEMNFMFDIGKCPKEACKISHLLLSHGHVDHAGGVIHYLFERKLKNLSPPKIYCPQSLVKPLENASHIFSSMHSSHYPADYSSPPYEQIMSLNSQFDFKVIPSFHSIESMAYLIYHKNDHQLPFIAYTGDTSIEIFDRYPELYKAKTLITECTYYLDKNKQNAKKYQHIHIQDLLSRSEYFENETISLIHPSSRHTKNWIQNFLKENGSSQFIDRCVVF